MERAQVVKALHGEVFEDQVELILAIRKHVEDGGTVVPHMDRGRMLLGWKDGDSDACWMFRLTFVRERRAGAFGDLIANVPGRQRIADAFNHGHGWFDTTGCPKCRIYVVEDVLLS
jgi:hypothetical protein